MTLDQIRKVHRQQPFQPFTLHLASGRSVRVPHPEFLWIPPQGSRTIWVQAEPEAAELIDLLLVESIEVDERKGKRKRNGKR